jgi:predicted nucleic acid-binding protein
VIVIDASAALELLLQTTIAAQVRSRLSHYSKICAPHVIDPEIVQVLRKAALSKRVDEARCRLALDDWRLLPVERYAHDPLLPRVWELRQNVSAYDAMYVALAESLDAPLLTHDARLAAGVGQLVRFELV